MLAGSVAGTLHFVPGGGGFTDPTDIGWHSLFWAEGPAFEALSYSEGATLTSWPNETAEVDATSVLSTPNYTASYTDLNNQPAVVITATEGLQTGSFTSAPSYASGVSIVVVGRVGTAPAIIVDGIAASNRNAIFTSTGNVWAVFAGTTVTGSASNTDPHLFVGRFDGSTGTETLSVDGTSAASGAGGVQTLTGLSIGRQWSSTSTGVNGAVALVGIYEGDVTSDPLWSGFYSWVSSHYGVTLA